MTGQRYISPYTDFGFKYIFGSELNKEYLISFLNALFEGRHHFKDVTYQNSEHLGEVVYARRAIFDVYCTTDQGEAVRAAQPFAADGASCRVAGTGFHLALPPCRD